LLSVLVVSQRADFQTARVKRFVDDDTILLVNGDEFCGRGEKFSESGVQDASEDWAGQVEGNWMELNGG
jgi:hypothetical protein